MKLFTSLFLATVLVGCATNPQVANIQAVAKQTFGSDTNLIIHEITPPQPQLDQYGYNPSFSDLDLRYDLLLGETQNVDLVVWGTSSAEAKFKILGALHATQAHRLPHLRLLFVGAPQDAERIRLTVEARGAQFYFHQK
ncbi:MAG: hypothetical protein WAW02_07325 [Sideroxyarcus sp.]